MKGLFSYRLVYAIGRSAYACFLPLYGASKLELSAAEIGVLISIHILLMSFSQFLGGRLADLYNRKVLVVLGSLISLSFLGFIPLMNSLWQLLVLSAFGALGGTLSMPASSAMTVGEGKKYGMGSAMGAFNMSMSIGMSIGPLLGGPIANAWGIDSVFYFAASVGVLGTGLFVWFTRPQKGLRLS